MGVAILHSCRTQHRDSRQQLGSEFDKPRVDHSPKGILSRLPRFDSIRFDYDYDYDYEHEHEHEHEHDESLCDARSLKGSDAAGVMEHDPGGDTDIERIGPQGHLDSNPLAARVDHLGWQSICLVAKEHQHRTSPTVLL